MLKYVLDWKPGKQPIDVFGVGDVIDVLNSRVTSLHPLPPVHYGLGAMTAAGEDKVGEGVIFRGRAGITPPTPRAGSDLEFNIPPEHVSTPFCVGWEGEPVATGWFTAEGGVTLLSIYETLLGEARARFKDIYIVLVEIIGLLPGGHIHDRALKKPVHQGNVLVTDPQYQHDYFRAGIIREERAALGATASEPLALAVVGLGYHPGGNHPALKQLERTVFYTPPSLGRAVQSSNSSIKTHSHALGWNDPALFHFLNNSSEWGMPAAVSELDRLVEQAAGLKPDYIVHLDEWSQVTCGWVRLFAAAPEDLAFR